MKKRNVVLAISVLLVGSLGLLLYQRGCRKNVTNGGLKKVVINEALRTVLYLPLYHAKEKGYFAEEGLDVDIITGGTATNSFAAMLSGEANFSVADPMYVPISREKGSRTKVVAQVVARIAVWGLTKNPALNELTADTLRGKKIATQPRPMTAYTYSIKTIKDLGLVPDKDVKIIETQAPNEIVPFLNGQADFTFTLEPNTSIAEAKGAKVVFSYPNKLGDQVFTGLMTTEDYIAKEPGVVQSVVNAYQHALQDLRANPEGGIASAKRYFPQLDEAVIRRAIHRIITEQVWPVSVQLSEESWNKAIGVRVEIGDLKHAVSLSECMDDRFSLHAIQQYPGTASK